MLQLHKILLFDILCFFILGFIVTVIGFYDAK
jgi:hypothetical protein